MEKSFELYAPNNNFFLRAFVKFRKATISFVSSVCLSVSPHETTHPLLDGFTWNFVLSFFLENMLRKFKFRYNPTRITDTLHEDFLHL